jgi:hypothetical protein
LLLDSVRLIEAGRVQNYIVKSDKHTEMAVGSRNPSVDGIFTGEFKHGCAGFDVFLEKLVEYNRDESPVDEPACEVHEEATRVLMVEVVRDLGV